MQKQHVTLTDADRTTLESLLAKGTLPVKTVKRATALLELDRGKPLTAVAATFVRPVPRLPHGRRHALRERRVPGYLARRRLRRPPEDQRPRGGQARPRPGAEGHSGARRRGPDRLPRRKKVRATPLRGHEGRGDRGRGTRAHRH